MDQYKIDRIESIFGFECFEDESNGEKQLLSFQHPKTGSVILIEEIFNRVPKQEPKYYVNCNPEIDCWDGWDDFREVIKQIKKYHPAI